MKVLFWAEWFPPHIGGVETFSNQLIMPLTARGHSITVVTSGGATTAGKPEMRLGVPVWRYPFISALDQRDLMSIHRISRELNDLIARLKPDLIHLNTVGPSTFFYLRDTIARETPTLLTLHMPVLLTDHANSIISRLLSRVDCVVGVSQASLDDAIQLVPSVADRSTLVLNALAPPQVAQKPLSTTSNTILFVGRLTHQKGIDVGLQAFQQVLTSYPSAELWIAGVGDAADDLRTQATQMGLNPWVHFLGPVDHREVYELLNQARMLLMPSRYEPFGLVALEAAQMARPVVASRVGGLEEVIVHQETGLLVDPENVAQLAGAISFLLDHPELCRQYGVQARQRAQQLFSFDRFIDAYDDLYHSLCNSA